VGPRPDHSETSCRRAGRLAGRKALIKGGDSGMGRAAAIAYAREGADVAINHLPQEELDAREVITLIRDCGRMGLSIPGDIRDETFRRSPKTRRLDGVAPGPIWTPLQVPPDFLCRRCGRRVMPDERVSGRRRGWTIRRSRP